MFKALIIVKKTIKILVWIIIGYVFLLVIIIVLIQVPFIQTELKNKAISYVTRKSHSVIRIKNIALSLTQSLIVESLYVEDMKKDTLLYVGRVSISLALYDLLQKNIHIRTLNVEDLVARMIRSNNDTLYNFSFLLTAFADTSTVKQVPQTASHWTFALDKLTLTKIHLLYDDS